MLTIAIDANNGTLSVASNLGGIDSERSQRPQCLTNEEARCLVAQDFELLEVGDLPLACQRVLDDCRRYDDDRGRRQLGACLREGLLGRCHGTSDLHRAASFATSG